MPWKMITTECGNWKRKENLFGNLQSKTALQCLLPMPCLVQYECNAYFQLKELHSIINYLAKEKEKTTTVPWNTTKLGSKTETSLCRCCEKKRCRGNAFLHQETYQTWNGKDLNRKGGN